MANPTKSALIAAKTAAYNAVTSNTGPLTDDELIRCFNADLDSNKTVDPVKGTPTVKYGV